MARMHSRDKGKSGSTKPINKEVPKWVTLKKKELEMIITKLAKEGKSTSQIGIHLRDVYGIPSAQPILGLTITAFLKEKELIGEIPEDLMSVMRRTIQIRKHLEENHKDMTAKRGLQLTESKLKRLVKYYKSTGALPNEWKYDAKSIRLYVE